MVNEIILNDTTINVTSYKEEIICGLQQISINFKVKSEEYHDISILLYEGTFNVVVPAKNIAFKATIQHYSTSITNLYQQDQVGDYTLCLLEVKN